MRAAILLSVILAVVGCVNGQGCSRGGTQERAIPHGNAVIALNPRIVGGISGRLTLLDGTDAVGAVVNLYRIKNGKEGFMGSELTDTRGRFCFSERRAGNYLLRT